MPKDSQAVNVRILDKDYKIACPVGEHKSLLSSAKYVDKQMRDIRKTGKVISMDRVAVMVALNIAHEMLNSQQQMSKIDNDVVEHLQQLQEKIQDTLNRVKPPT